jgi:spermidine/putrescine transport system substrate-binding protein
MFIDAMCIPTCAKEKEAAELLINFLCEPEIAGANMDWICYGTPLSAAKEFIDPETVADPVTYPNEESLVNGSSFAYLPEEISRYMESLFMDVRNS